MPNIEAEVKEIKQRVIEISEKLGEVLYQREAVSVMKLAETSLSEFLKNEPDVYKIEDLKVRYK